MMSTDSRSPRAVGSSPPDEGASAGVDAYSSSASAPARPGGIREWELDQVERSEVRKIRQHRSWDLLTRGDRWGVWAIYVRSVVIAMWRAEVWDGNTLGSLLPTVYQEQHGTETAGLSSSEYARRLEEDAPTVQPIVFDVLDSLAPAVTLPDGEVVGNWLGMAEGGAHYDKLSADPAEEPNVGSYLWGRVQLVVKARLGQMEDRPPQSLHGLPEEQEAIPLPPSDYDETPTPFASVRDPLHWLWRFVEQMETLVDHHLWSDDLALLFEVTAMQSAGGMTSFEVAEEMANLKRLRSASYQALLRLMVVLGADPRLSPGQSLALVVQGLTCGDKAGTRAGVELHQAAISEAEASGVQEYDFYLLHGLCPECRAFYLRRCKQDGCEAVAGERMQYCYEHSTARGKAQSAA